LIVIDLPTEQGIKSVSGTASSENEPHSRPAGVRDIAKALSISTGTVDRALHNRKGISPVTRMRVMQMAERLGYRPNLAARFLSSRKQLTIGVCLPKEIASFFDGVRGGIRDACRPVELSSARIVESLYPRIGIGEVEAFEKAIELGADGIIVAPAYPEKMKRLIRKASSRGIAVVCVATDAPGTERISTIAVDPFSSGFMAAELLGRFLAGAGTVATITGFLSTADHAQKIAGFSHGISTHYPGIEVRSTIEAHDDETEAYEKSSRLLKQNPGLKGIYISTANCLPTLRALTDLDLQEKVTLITTDLFPEIVPAIRSGAIAATIHQRPRTQGRMAFEALWRFLADRTCPAPFTKLAPHIVMRSNLDLFVNELSGAPEQNENPS
jgi:LacI family transcriptional regulator